MSSRVRRLALTGLVAVSMCGFNVAIAAPPAGACVDHSDHGGGNYGDPGDGGNHHNEDRGRGNGGDPGNGQGHFCSNE